LVRYKITSQFIITEESLYAHIINLPYRFLRLKHTLIQWARWS